MDRKEAIWRLEDHFRVHYDGRRVMGWENFCPDCGQAIDWSEQE